MTAMVSTKRSLPSSSESSCKIARVYLSEFPDRMMSTEQQNDTNPCDFLAKLLKLSGVELDIIDSMTVEGFFEDYTEAEVNSYDNDILTAVRSEDIDRLREFHADGRPMKCANQFGESILHLACRRNFFDVAQFLIKEAKISVRIRDDYGRNILHDAAWACEPNFDLIELILEECPDLLFMKDRRGHTPVSYARRSHWAQWNKFFHKRAGALIPKA
eukprot:CAMPEP_0178907486 /NCGR_PEP_ID=MMETSP0786-20121207/7400_1 /TAXON_ID=186022 /ORGANISM="Thalassionema frauenfeldii, Strain CCMP 1798" /LENGTH=215 /DNA_ID=CAMNT_0020579295 /DNA_START=103 /DNA_END=746 /DNA_ORIENTATION=+